jgi:hypothetical protein
MIFSIRLLRKQAKLEAQYAAKREAHTAEINDLRQQLEQKTNDIRLMNNTVETLKGVNDELKVRCLKIPACDMIEH